MSLPEQPIFTFTTKIPFYAVFVFLIPILVVFGIPFLEELPELLEGKRALFIGIGILLIFLFILLFAQIRVRLCSTYMVFGFPFIGKKVMYKDILSFEPVIYSWKDFGGWGIRKGKDGSIIYNIPGDKGKAVRLVINENGREKVFLFSAKEPEAVCQKIRELRGSW
jgi:hypothetical protein